MSPGGRDPRAVAEPWRRPAGRGSRALARRDGPRIRHDGAPGRSPVRLPPGAPARNPAGRAPSSRQNCHARGILPRHPLRVSLVLSRTPDRGAPQSTRHASSPRTVDHVKRASRRDVCPTKVRLPSSRTKAPMGAPRRQSIGCITSPEAPRFPKPPRSASAEGATRPPPPRAPGPSQRPTAPPKARDASNGAGKSSGVRRKPVRERSGGIVEEVVADLRKDPRWDD